MNRQASSPPLHRVFITVAGTLALLLCASSGIQAQLRIVGSISGTVQDPTGAVIANARVVAKDQSTGISREVTSTERGTFLEVGGTRDVELVPFYRLHRRTYSVYFDIFTPSEWERKAADLLAERERQQKLNAATVAFVQPGEMQPERDFNQQGEESAPVRMAGRAGRSAKKWFSFDVPVDPSHRLKLIATYHGEERANRSFAILVDGMRIGEQTIERHRPGSASKSFFDVEYAIPPDVVKGKQKVTVKFQATRGDETAGVFGVRVVRVD